MPDRGVKFTQVDLSTGSRVAVARLEEGRSKVPVVFLHGGPGRPTTTSDVTFFKSVAAEGFDVILFDQAGVGESPRLPRNEISLDRAIRDLEALREKLALPSMMLVGQSWGARLAYEYTAQHPDRVARLVIAGGAPLRSDPTEWQFDEHRTGVAHGKPGPFPGRFLTFVALMKTNPSAADAFIHDEEELDAMMGSVVPAIQLRSVCTKDAPSIKTGGMTGLDGTQFVGLRPFIESANAPPIATPPPSLVLRAECDFAQWRTARDYRDRLHAKVIFIEGAGHAMWPLQADATRAALVSFLRDGSTSRPPYEGDDDPAR
jgi:proline iminopeptidase